MRLKKLAALLMLCAMCVGHRAALEYTMDAQDKRTLFLEIFIVISDKKK